MDEYGFLAAATVALRIFEEQSRHTGRTMRLIERVTEEDQIIAPTIPIARFIETRLRDAGKPKTRVIVVDPAAVPFSRVCTAARGRTFFDHTWALAYIEVALRRATVDLDDFQREMSKTWPAKPESTDASGERIVDFSRRFL